MVDLRDDLLVSACFRVRRDVGVRYVIRPTYYSKESTYWKKFIPFVKKLSLNSLKDFDKEKRNFEK